MLNTLKLFWFTIDSSVLLNEGVQFFSLHLSFFFVYIADCIKLYKKIISPWDWVNLVSKGGYPFGFQNTYVGGSKSAFQESCCTPS